MDWILCLTAGAAAGVIMSLIGVGSGFVLIPALTLAFSLTQPNYELALLMAIATTHAANIFMSAAAIQNLSPQGKIEWRAFCRLAPGIVLGSIIGGLLVYYIKPLLVACIFAGFAMFAAQRLLQPTPCPVRRLPAFPVLSTMGVIIGALASLAGAGAFVGPLLARYLDPRLAFGTSAAIVLPLSIPAAIVMAAHDVPAGFGSQSLGLIHLPSVFGAALAACLTLSLGTWLSRRLPVLRLKRLFATFLIVMAVGVLMKALPITNVLHEATRASLAQFAFAPTVDLPDPKQMPAWLRSEPAQDRGSNKKAESCESSVTKNSNR